MKEIVLDRGFAGRIRAEDIQEDGNLSQLNIKFEQVLALVMMVLLMPIILLVATLLLVVGGRPLFCGLRRSGERGREFTMWKFRTLPVETGNGIAGPGRAGEIPPVLRWIRARRLDELPQIWNVVRGDIRFIGPRPPAPEFVQSDPALYQRVLANGAGVSGLASLVFHRHEAWILSHAKDQAQADELYKIRCIRRKARIDLIYQSNRNWVTDLWLFWVTGLWAVGLVRGGRLPRIRMRIRKGWVFPQISFLPLIRRI